MEKDTPRAGGYYLDDGPGDNPPRDLDSIPDPVPRLEPLHRGASRPYAVMGRDYMPMTTLARYKARGTATWYGRRYHGKRTSSGEVYDMYAMTAAHTTLPIPSYARVTNLGNGKSVVVRVNDRGPFIGDRLIDLSYVAAHKLGLLGKGSALVEVESILPGDPAPAGTVETGRPSPDPSSPYAPLATVAPQAPSVGMTMAAPQPEAAAASPVSAEAALPAATVPPEATPEIANGIYVQLAAFRSRENAVRLLGRLKAQMGWLSERLGMGLRGGLYRVHAGPYPSHGEARVIANRIGESLGPPPIVLKW